jgi:hypothetical protein
MMMTAMSRLLAFSAAVSALLMAGPASAQTDKPAPGASVCLRNFEIDHTESPNDKTILFHMRNGDIWRNDLKSPCPGLSVHGYAERLHTDMVCANSQIIYVLQVGNSCVLGDFTRVSQRPQP